VLLLVLVIESLRPEADHDYEQEHDYELQIRPSAMFRESALERLDNLRGDQRGAFGLPVETVAAREVEVRRH
jgi:hypothetical protein